MKTSSCIRHSTWNPQFFSRQGLYLLSFLTLVIGNPCTYYSNTVKMKTIGDETTYTDSVGHSLELFCTLTAAYDKSFTRKNLSFQRDDQVIDKNQTIVVNERTIGLRLENKEAYISKYYCFLDIPKELNEIAADSSDNEVVSENKSDKIQDPDSSNRETICWNTVQIVAVPKKAENISCTVHNFQELNCTWIVPSNDFQANYTIRYEPALSKNGTVEAFACPNDNDVHNYTCKWTLSTKPPYRKDFEKLRVIVTGVNMMNNTKETSIVFDQFSIVRPKGPTNLRLVGNKTSSSKTQTSINLEWSIGEMQYLLSTWVSKPQISEPWAYRIRYKTTKSDWSSWLFLDSKNVTTNGARVSYNVTNLTPGTLYDFQVFMKPHNASDNYWSEGYAGKVFGTKKL